MTKEKSLLILGIIVIALPNLGFPNGLEKIIFAVLGVLVIIAAYAMHFEKNKKTKTKKSVSQSVEDNSVVVAKTPTKEEITGFTYIKKDVTNDLP